MASAPRSAARWCLALLLAATVSGCGSTVAVDSTSAGGAAPGTADAGSALGAPLDPGTGQAVGAPAADLGVPQAGGLPAAEAPGTTAGPAAAPAPRGGGAGPAPTRPGAAQAPAAGPAAPGGPVDRTPVRVGALYLDGGNAALSAGFAATAVNFGDGRLEAKAVVADINRRGGIGGRPVQLFLEGIAATDASKPQAFDVACSSLVEDHKVFAIMSMFNLRSPLAACAAKNRVLLLDAALGAGDDDLYERFGEWVFTPSAMSLNTEQTLVLDEAVARGLVGPTKKVGVVVQEDDDIFPRVFRTTIAPRLKALKVPFEQVSIASATDNTGISSAILRFKSNGVQVVQFSAGNGGIPVVLFMQAAEQQQYRPTYVLGDSQNSWFVGDSGPPEQVKQVRGVGSYPIANVSASQYPTTPAERRCLDVITQAGQPVRDRHSSLTATFYCETLYGFDAAGDLVQGRLTADAWRAAYRSLGARYPTTTTFAADVGKDPNAGARAYRSLSWQASCRCITYTSALTRLP